MRRTVGIALVVLGFAAAGIFSSAATRRSARQAAQQQAQTQQTQQQTTPPGPPVIIGSQGPIVTQVKEVDMILAVVNRREQFVTDLGQNDFKVFEDNRPQDVKFFSRQTDLPLRVALLLDTSNSVRPRLDFEKDAATDFLYNVMRPNRDMATLMIFDSEPEVIQPFTSDLDKLRDSITAQRAGGGTALYDAMVKASQLLSNAPPPKTGPPEMRRVMIVISDGDDNESRLDRSDAVETAQRDGVVVYTISTSTEWIVPEDTDDPKHKFDRTWAKTGGDKVLEGFADDTGGRPFFPYRVDDVAQSFLDIGTELRSQYLLGYEPMNGAADGKFRKVRIEIPGHKELEVRTRKGYYATPASATPLAAPGAGGQ
jgi:Ca-activated chloride channel homolog